MDHEEYKRKALEPIVNYIESVLASYSKEEIESRIKEALPKKESEDERIRKRLVEYFNGFYDKYSCRNNVNVHWEGIEVKKVLAYLEKQKEQKLDCKYECALTDEQLMATDFWKEYLKESIISGNKPTKADIDFLLPIARKYFCLVMKEACTICKDWSNGYQEGLEAGRQKPAEVNVKALLTADRLASAEMTGRLKERSEIINNPEKYGLQKPAEWSEEDENIRQSLINDLENAETEDEDVQKELNEKVAWLKSLRPQPHWKPSEEQMEVLERCVDYLDDSDNEDAVVIGSLCHDLKSL